MTDEQPQAEPTSGAEDVPQSDAERFPDVAELGYEEARDELTSIVARLEGGAATLEESMQLWERGEALARHCQSWLDRAEQRLDARAGTDDD